MRVNVNKHNIYFSAFSENIPEEEWNASSLKVAMGILDRLSDMNPTMGFALVSNSMQSQIDVLVDVVAFPVDKELVKFKSTGTYGQMTKHTMTDFDVIALSVYYYQHYLNVPAFLMFNHISPLSKDRGENDPIIMGGGQALSNPEPMAPLFDIIVIGEGEEVVVDIINSLKETKGQPKEQRLLALTKFEGVYVPRFYEERYEGDKLIGHFPLRNDVPAIIKKRTVADITIRDLLSPPNEVSLRDRYLWDFSSHTQSSLGVCETEVARGCQNKCSYCALSFFFHPHRKVTKEFVLKHADICQKALKEKNRDLKIFLVAPDVTGNEFMDSVFQELIHRSIKTISLDNRVDNFTKEMAEVRVASGAFKALFGVEGYSQRLRNMVNKQITDDEIKRSVQYCYDAGIGQIKLGFIWGFPTQTREDIEEYIELYSWAKKLSRVRNPNIINKNTGVGKQMIVDCAHTVFRSMPYTPMQYFGFHSFAKQVLYLKTEQDKIHKLYGSGLRGLMMSGEDLVKFDMLLTKGDRRMALPLIELSSRFTYQEGGIKGEGVQHIYNLCKNIKLLLMSI
jgi:radical SAM superfamily enzyme YgiQ (UPF0313 family)